MRAIQGIPARRLRLSAPTLRRRMRLSAPSRPANAPNSLFLQREPGHGVDRHKRLVHEDHVGIGHPGACDRHALAHAAGELVRIAILEPGKAGEIERNTIMDHPPWIRGPSPFEARPPAKLAAGCVHLPAVGEHLRVTVSVNRSWRKLL